MIINIKSSAKLFWQLLKTDLIIYKQDIIDLTFNAIIWVSLLTIIISYVYPQFGMFQYFGSFFLVGTIVSICLSNIMSSTARLLVDLEDNNVISYYLTLPNSSWLYFVKLGVGYACKTIVISIIILPLGKLILWDKINFSNLSLYKFFLIYLTINFSMGMITVFMASLIKNIMSIGSLWCRFIFPLWFLGGPAFPWQTIYNLSPKLAILCLFNPLLYLMEGVRAAVLGQHSFINFWICLFVAWAFSIFLGWIGIYRFQKRLDLV